MRTASSVQSSGFEIEKSINHYASQHAIFLFARIPQILKNFSNKSTGQLSFLSCLMNFAGSIVRVFTSVILGSAIGVMAHGTILSQIILYQITKHITSPYLLLGFLLLPLLFINPNTLSNIISVQYLHDDKRHNEFK
ncbi:mannose-P-dolichol utilization defect 1 protein homolog 2-like isoform X4 [Mercurialis annua]|uniref:mannose-P-dolichol utilization defect 1 protein homolog 2-like isoform X4 n=1 Tax=Mercurialis annua TaxID=3986 RepID=UPI00215F4CB0|nr:mannose-P-dolichol utilization defect 1 protein homolog 2-like isoform X4 [Mercurialis annua]